MLAIRNSAASEARTSAAQTSLVGSSPDSGTNREAKPGLEFVGFSAGDGFMDASQVWRIGLDAKKASVSRSLFFNETAIA